MHGRRYRFFFATTASGPIGSFDTFVSSDIPEPSILSIVRGLAPAPGRNPAPVADGSADGGFDPREFAEDVHRLGAGQRVEGATICADHNAHGIGRLELCFDPHGCHARGRQQ